MALTDKLTAIANAIRAKTGKSGALKLEAMPDEIMSIGSGGGGLAWADVLYEDDALAITYTSTSAGTAKTITGLTGIATYPFIVVIIQNTDTRAGTLKFIRSCTEISNLSFASGGVSVGRYGSQHYHTSSGTLTNASSTSYGLWGYTITAAGNLTIRGRCNSAYYNSLTGTYKVRVLGIKSM